MATSEKSTVDVVREVVRFYMDNDYPTGASHPHPGLTRQPTSAHAAKSARVRSRLVAHHLADNGVAFDSSADFDGPIQAASNWPDLTMMTECRSQPTQAWTVT